MSLIGPNFAFFHIKVTQVLMSLIGPNFAFFHIPRTGGTWVRKALELAYPEGSLTEQETAHSLPFTTPGLLRFTIVRGWVPWKKSFMNLVGRQSEPLPEPLALFRTIIESFPEEDEKRLSVERCVFPYIDGVDRLLHTETLKEDMRSLLKALGRDASVVDQVPEEFRNSTEQILEKRRCRQTELQTQT